MTECVMSEGSLGWAGNVSRSAKGRGWEIGGGRGRPSCPEGQRGEGFKDGGSQAGCSGGPVTSEERGGSISSAVPCKEKAPRQRHPGESTAGRARQLGFKGPGQGLRVVLAQRPLLMGPSTAGLPHAGTSVLPFAWWCQSLTAWLRPASGLRQSSSEVAQDCPGSSFTEMWLGSAT